MKHLYTLFLLTLFTFVQAQQKHTVYFDLDIDVPNSSSVNSFDTWLQQNKDAIVFKIYGYADTIGSVPYNKNLSLRRANDIVSRLKQNNIAFAEGVEIKGFGEQFEKDSDQAKNRKVEVYYELPVVEADVVKPELKPKKTVFAQKVEKSKVGDKLRLENLNFYGGSAHFLPESIPVLEELLAVMKSNSNLKIEIQGHICCEKKVTHPVSSDRAKAVYSYLNNNGIPHSRISYKDYGATSPIYSIPERNEKERVTNRRVEIKIIAN
ncbi:OmpA family protein [Flavobacterium rakeshii]|uniref:OmpA family protein n=1 Tax=Flavobacterium rakeshii TaxID=1038845 RepID=UPI002E7B4C83|nr:OmpA family protein [Flavobacterium rakeshii]MEE1898505.1 OmpA family protein [Flavobacterium rakeshii]